MPEQVTLTTPIASSLTTWQVARLLIDRMSQLIVIELVGSTGAMLQVRYPTPAPPEHASQPTGQDLISTLNTVNLSTNSLQKRVLQRVQADGYIGSGGVTGSPE